MKTVLKKGLAVLSLLCLQAPAWALDGVSISGGANLDVHTPKADFVHASIRDSFNGRWLKNETGVLVAHWEAGIGHWNPQGHGNWAGNALVAARYEFNSNKTWGPYVEYGWGGAYVSRLQASDHRTLSTHFQFINRLEVGLRFGEKQENELGLAYWHYSNGGIKKPNPGVDFLSLRYTHRL